MSEINPSNAGDVHSGRAGFLGKTFSIQKPQSLKLIHRHLDALNSRGNKSPRLLRNNCILVAF